MLYNSNVRKRITDSELRTTAVEEEGQTEYGTSFIHSNGIITDAEKNPCMKVKSPISENVYRVELIFSETSAKAGEEIRGILKEKYIRGEIGSGQKNPGALHFLPPEEALAVKPDSEKEDEVQ
ncbi:MAG TPA: hypothetical protein DCG10_07935 [Lachnospiraceae bacterium]|nr:hypothetical protein [Lachnospiraceae bacterium]